MYQHSRQKYSCNRNASLGFFGGFFCLFVFLGMGVLLLFFFCCCFLEGGLVFIFCNWIVPMGLLPWEIRIAFPGESQLRQSRATQPWVYYALFKVIFVRYAIAYDLPPIRKVDCTIVATNCSSATITKPSWKSMHVPTDLDISRIFVYIYGMLSVYLSIDRDVPWIFL